MSEKNKGLIKTNMRCGNLDLHIHFRLTREVHIVHIFHAGEDITECFMDGFIEHLKARLSQDFRHQAA